MPAMESEYHMAFVFVAKASGIPAGSMKPVNVSGKPLTLANVGGRFFAFQNPCSHMGGHLSEGMMLGNVIVCPLHGCQFDITTGQHLSGPANKPIKTYAVKVEGDDVMVDAGS
jgi:nitrite reductase/ring-hydroxylating ferredoxin subunit